MRSDFSLNNNTNTNRLGQLYPNVWLRTSTCLVCSPKTTYLSDNILPHEIMSTKHRISWDTYVCLKPSAPRRDGAGLFAVCSSHYVGHAHPHPHHISRYRQSVTKKNRVGSTNSRSAIEIGVEPIITLHRSIPVLVRGWCKQKPVNPCIDRKKDL